MTLDEAPHTAADRTSSGVSVLLPGSQGVVAHEFLAPVDSTPPHHDGNLVEARVFYAAPHVVADPWSGGNGPADRIDWETTLAFRRHLWSLGLGVAEAMDTAQRGMGLDWTVTRELVRQVAAEADGRRLAAGASTDQLEPTRPASLDEIERAYIEQCQHIESLGAIPVIMASRSLATVAAGTADYTRVYDRVLTEVDGPVMLHWLGDAFDPQLSGYWGSTELDAAADALIDIVGLRPEKIDGVKISILDARRERALRRRMPPGVRVYTGDDYNYADLIRGDELGHSDALLGAFNPLAAAAARALDALNRGDLAEYDRALLPTVPLARHLFAAPTQYYKTGVVFLAYVNGHQDHFRMLGGFETARSALHLAEIVRLADQAGVIVDPELAATRVRRVMATYGVDE